MKDKNSGNRNSGNRNSGNRNSGNRNSGYWNSGEWNSGNCNSGNLNSGDRNSGNRNSGNRNSGNWNSGYWNSGNLNSGEWNSGDRNSGFFNTTEPPLRLFNKECIGLSHADISFPNFIYFDITEWINSESMTDSEKSEHPSHETTGGYLKTHDYKDAFQSAYANASDADKAKLLALPNFDADVFFEISGIDVHDPLAAKIEKLERELAELKREVAA